MSSGVDLGLGEAERLDAELMELAVAALLRFLAPEHRAAAPELLLLVVQQSIAERGAHDAGGRLRAHRDALAVIVERVHLFRDDVGELADRAAEELRPLEHGKSHALVAVCCKELGRRAFDSVPKRRVRGQHVVHAANRLNQVGHGAAQSETTLTEKRAYSPGLPFAGTAKSSPSMTIFTPDGVAEHDRERRLAAICACFPAAPKP